MDDLQSGVAPEITDSPPGLRIRRIGYEELNDELHELLRARYERLGYLGEFFQVGANQPDALAGFVRFTESLRETLPEELADLVALTAATKLANQYEKNQHEQLALRHGKSREWIAAAVSGDPSQSEALTAEERTAQQFTLALLRNSGHGVDAEMSAALDQFGPEATVAIVLFVGRFAAHALLAKLCRLYSSGSLDLRERRCSRWWCQVTEDTLWLNEWDVAELVDLKDAIAAVSDGFVKESTASAISLEKTMTAFKSGQGHGTLHALGAAFESDGLVGTKVWAHTPGGADPHVVIFNGSNGRLVAVIEAFLLGQLRTAASAAIATDQLAQEDATTMAVIGTGAQALSQVAAVAAVRTLDVVNCYSRGPENRERFATLVESELGLRCVPADSAAAAVADCSIATLITRATTPVLLRDELPSGAHLNAIGAIALDRMEFEPSLLERCAVVATDSIPQSERFSGELQAFYGGVGDERWQALRFIGDLVAKGESRPENADLTVFKGMGSGIEDVAMGIKVVERAVAAGAGTRVARQDRGRPSPRLV